MSCCNLRAKTHRSVTVAQISHKVDIFSFAVANGPFFYLSSPQSCVTLLCRATDLRNNYFLTTNSNSEAFTERLFTECMLQNRRVLVEELQLGPAQQASFGDLPPNAALVISFIDVEGIVGRLCEEAKKASLQLGGEPAPKRVRKHGDSLRIHQIVSCLRDQCYVPLPENEAETDDVPNSADMETMSAPQIRDAIFRLLGAQAWRERIRSDWAKKLLFHTALPLRPALKPMPRVWLEEDPAPLPAEPSPVIGICASNATDMGRVVRPCFANFSGETYLLPLQLQALCLWNVNILKPLVPELMKMGIKYQDAIELLQAEMHEALRTAPHDGVGIEASHRGIFTTVETNGAHIHQCQTCLEIFAKMQAKSRSRGFFSVCQYIFELRGVGAAKSFCSFLMMLTMQVIVGSATNEAVAGNYMLVGRYAKGKTHSMDAVAKLLPSYLTKTFKSSSPLGLLWGSQIAGFRTFSMVRSIRTCGFDNEAVINDDPAALTINADGYFGRNSGRAVGEDGQRQETLDTTVVWTGCIKIGACNNMFVKDVKGGARFNSAMMSRFEEIHGMDVPDNVQQRWPDQVLQKRSDCAGLLFHHLLAMMDFQTLALSELTSQLVPSIAVSIAVFDTLVKPSNIAGRISLRSTNRLRAATIAAWRAEQISYLLLSGRSISMCDVLVSLAMPIPYEFAIFMVQATNPVESGHAEYIEAFGLLGKQAELLPAPTELPNGIAILPGIPFADPKVAHRKLKKVATGLTVNPDFSADNMEMELMQLPHHGVYGVPVHLLCVHPHKATVQAAMNILLILHEMAERKQLLTDDEHVYLPHCLCMWLNGQDVPLIDRIRDRTPIEGADAGNRAVHNVGPNANLSDEDVTVLAELSEDLIKLNELRAPGIVWALIHCGAECPTLTGNNNYPLSDALKPFVHAVAKKPAAPPAQAKSSKQRVVFFRRNAAEAAPESEQGGDQEASAEILPTDYVHGEKALSRLDFSPDVYRPMRFLLRSMKTPPTGVSMSLRKIESEMPLPGPVEIDLMNNGIVVLRPSANQLKYGNKLTAERFDVNNELCAHPNDQLGDALTCFNRDGSFEVGILYYMHTLYNLLYVAPSLLRELDDDIILRNAQHFQHNVHIDWAINEQSERSYLAKKQMTTTVRMVLLAFVIECIGISDRIRIPADFVRHLIETTDHGLATDLVPCIIRFITKHVKVARLLMCSRETAESIIEQKDDTDRIEYFSSMVATYPAEVQDELKPCITLWYEKLRARLDRVFEPAAFDDYNETFKRRFKEA